MSTRNVQARYLMPRRARPSATMKVKLQASQLQQKQRRWAAMLQLTLLLQSCSAKGVHVCLTAAAEEEEGKKRGLIRIPCLQPHSALLIMFRISHVQNQPEAASETHSPPSEMCRVASL